LSLALEEIEKNKGILYDDAVVKCLPEIISGEKLSS